MNCENSCHNHKFCNNSQELHKLRLHIKGTSNPEGVAHGRQPRHTVWALDKDSLFRPLSHHFLKEKIFIVEIKPPVWPVRILMRFIEELHNLETAFIYINVYFAFHNTVLPDAKPRSRDISARCSAIYVAQGHDSVYRDKYRTVPTRFVAFEGLS